MTLKPDYVRGFTKPFVTFFVLLAIFEGAVPFFQHKVVQWDSVLGMAGLIGLLFGGFSCFLTPRQIVWDTDMISIKALFPGSGEFAWRQLEAWSPYGRGTFLLKFEGRQAFQIPPSSFRPSDWKVFRAFLDLRFRDKKTLLWFGVTPIRFSRK
jgi:hypothetical protein